MPLLFSTRSRSTCLVALSAMAFALAPAGCAVATDETSEGEETSATGEANLSEAKQPKVELGLEATATSPGAKVGKGVCVSSQLVVLPNLRGEDLFKNVADVIVTDDDTGWQKVIASIEIPKNGFIIHNLDKTENPIRLQGALGSLSGYENHKLAVQIIQKRKMNGKIVGQSPRLTFVMTDPRADLVTAQRSASCPLTGPNGCYLTSFRIYPKNNSVSADDYVCDSIQLRISDASSSYYPQLTPSVFRGGKLESALSAGVPWGNEFHATGASLVKGSVISNVIPLP